MSEGESGKEWRAPNAVVEVTSPIVRFRVSRVEWDGGAWVVEIDGGVSAHRGVAGCEGVVVEVPAEEEVAVRVRSLDTLGVSAEGVLRAHRRTEQWVQMSPAVASVYVEVL